MTNTGHPGGNESQWLPGSEWAQPDPSEWTNADWEKWFREEVEPTSTWNDIRVLDAHRPEVGSNPEEWTDKQRLYDLKKDIEYLFRYWTRAHGFSRFSPFAPRDFAGRFARASDQSKMDFFNAWSRIQEPEPESEEDLHHELNRGFLGNNWRRWAVPVVLAGAIVGWVWIGGFGTTDEAREAINSELDATGTDGDTAGETSQSDESEGASVGQTIAVVDPTGDWMLIGPGDPEPGVGPPDFNVIALDYSDGGPWVITFDGDAERLWSNGEVERAAVELIFVKPNEEMIHLIWDYFIFSEPTTDTQVSATTEDDKRSVQDLNFDFEGEQVMIRFSGLELPPKSTVHVSVVAKGLDADAESVVDVTDPVEVLGFGG